MNKRKITLNSSRALLNSVISNENVKLHYSKSLLEYTQEYLESVSDKYFDYKDQFDTAFLALHDENRIETSDDCAASSLINEVMCLYSNYQSINFILSKEVEPTWTINNYGCFDKVARPNRDWLIFTIVANAGVNDISLRYNHFINQGEIDNFFDVLFRFTRGGKRIHLQSNYVKLGSVFNSIYGRKITFYSCNYHPKKRNPKSPSELSVEGVSLKALLGTNCSYKTTSEESVLHRRAIVHGNLCLTTDHQFNEIVHGNKNWKVTFIYSEDDSEEYLNQFSNFS